MRNKIVIKCKNCGFSAIQIDNVFDMDNGGDDEDVELDTCPRCFCPIVDIEDEEEMSEFNTMQDNKDLGTVHKFELED